MAAEVRDLDLESREERIFEEVSKGNVPAWLRRMEGVAISGVIAGCRHEAEFWVTPDYLSVGSDTASFLVPFSPGVAQWIADLVGASLPTPKMVDAIWASARYRLAPIRIGPNEHITTVRYFERHDRLVHRRIFVDGVVRDLLEVLSDPELAPLLSDVGVIENARYPSVREEL
jgi:hypothetical protein